MYCVSAVRTGPLHLSELQHKRTLCNSHTTLSDGKVVLYLTSNRTVTYNFLRLRLDIAILARCNGRVGNDNRYRLTGTCQSIQEVIEFRGRSDVQRLVGPQLLRCSCSCRNAFRNLSACSAQQCYRHRCHNLIGARIYSQSAQAARCLWLLACRTE